MMNKPRIAILGAGPAGLGAAFKLTQENRAVVTVLERAPFVGGNAGSFEFGGQNVDFGSHRLHPSCDPEILKDLRSLLGDSLLKRPRQGRIHLCNRWIRFPLKPMDLLLRLDRKFALGVLRDMLYRRDPGPTRASIESFESVLRSQLGPTISEQFYLPYARKIWGRSPEELSAVQAHKRISAGSFRKLLRKVFGGLPGVRALGFDHYFYPRLGYGQISESLAEAATVAGAEIHLGSPVVRLEVPNCEDSSWRIAIERSGQEQIIEVDQVWSSIPITALPGMMDPPCPPNIAVAARSIHHRAMVLVYLQIGVDRFSDFDAHYFPDPAVTISRLSEPKHYSDSSEPQGKTVLCAELPCSTEDEVWSMAPEDLAARVAQDLATAGIPLPGSPTLLQIRKLAQAYPIYDIGFEDHLRIVEEWLQQLPRFVTYGRQGLFVHDNTHHALSMAYSAVRCLVDGQFDSREWKKFRRVFETHVVED